MAAKQFELWLTSQVRGLPGDAPVAASSRHVVTVTDTATFSDAVADAGTANHNGLALAIADMELIYFKCDQVVTVQFNTVGQSFDLAAGMPLVWFLTDDAGYTYPYSNPIAADINVIDVTNNSGATANYEFIFGLTT